MILRVGSVSSGIGGDHVAWGPLGWEPVFVSEIAAFPSAVLAHRLPGVPNLGDFNAPDFCARARALGGLDVFAGGTPCQAFSVAGKRKSMDDARGNLTLRYVEIVHELDPAVAVWENVPGVLSTKDNAFGCFLAGMVGESEPLASGLERGRWPNTGVVVGPIRTLCWRVLDAQYLGLAQRRRRVCLVSFRTRDGINPAAVLLEPESVRRDSAPSREAGSGVAGTLAGCSAGSGHRCGSDEAAAGQVVAHPLLAKANDSHAEDMDTYVTAAPRTIHLAGDQAHAEISENLAGTLNCDKGQRGGIIAHTLRGEGFDASEDGTGRGTPIVPVAIAQNQRGEVRAMDVIPSRGVGGGKPGEGYPAVAFVERGREGGRSCESQEDLAYTLLNPGEGGRTSEGCITDQVLRVRRLTPRECERLQGFPDGWTRIPWRKKPADKCPDGPRYKGLGNAWATNVFRWIGARIALVLEASGRDLAQDSADVAETANGADV